jgi:signal transduction histidine kinase/AmiR/NasT family two-component response regulator
VDFIYRRLKSMAEGGQARSRAGRDEALDHAAERSVLGSQLDRILRHSGTATIISTAFAFILAVYLAPVFGAKAYIWFGLKVASALPRFVCAQAYRLGWWKPSVPTLAAFIWTSFVVDGAVWGLAGIWGAGAHSETVALIVACISSVAMLATFALQVQFKATMAYVAPMLCPMAIALLTRSDTLGLFAAGGTILVLVQTVVTSLASQRRATKEYLANEQLKEALEEVKRQSSVKTLFLGSMSHELRTPLHGILGLTELIQRETSGSTVSSHLKLIRSSGEHLLELISALLDVSRIDAGKLELHPVAVDLALEFRAVAELYAVRAGSKGLAFEVELQLGEACWVNADLTRLRQVLHNLLGNAVKFTKRGVITFKAWEDGGSIACDVGDTGPGIDAKDLPHIFEAFRQTNMTSSSPAEGAGLGLTIARELAHAMGGDLTAESTVGVGSRFHFEFKPEWLATSEIPLPSKDDTAHPQQLRSSFHVLLVEDNDVNALIASAYLDQLGVRTTRVNDGRQAVEAAFVAPRPDLILMDCRMPVLDGIAATREIRMIERSAKMTRVPVLALTANPGEEDRAECFAAGMDGFLVKPFTAAQFMNAVRVYVKDLKEERVKTHPLFQLAASLEDTEPDGFGEARRTMH